MRIRQKHYLLTRLGRIKTAAEGYRKAYIERKHEIDQFCRQYGAERFSLCTQSMLLHGLVFYGQSPEGWTKPSSSNLSWPKKTKANKDILRHFQPNGRIESWKPLVDLMDALGCPTEYEYKGKNCSGFTSIGSPFEPIGVYWYAEDGPLMVVLPDVAAEDAKCKAKGYSVKDDALSWRPPKSMKEISPAEWDLMCKKAEVLRERAARD